MMIDPQILTSIQIACIGIIVVIGLFLIWRSLNKLHEKVERLSCECATMCAANCTAPCSAPRGGAAPASKSRSSVEAEEAAEDADMTEDEDELTDEDRELMNAIFEGTDPINSQATFMLFSPFGPNGAAAAQPNGSHPTSSRPQVEIEELSEMPSPPAPSAPFPTPNAQAVPERRLSDDGTVETSAGPSKTKLKKMSVEALKDLLQSRGLSTEGTKNQLIDRLIAD